MKNNKTKIYIAIAIIVVIAGMIKLNFVSGGAVSSGGRDTLEEIGLEYYLEQTGESKIPKDVEAIVKNLGCHKEIHIYRDGNVVMKLIYFNGQVYEI